MSDTRILSTLVVYTWTDGRSPIGPAIPNIVDMKSPVKALLSVVSFVLVVGGISGLLREWFDWFGLFGFLRFLTFDGYEIYCYVVLIILGVALGVAGGRAKS